MKLSVISEVDGRNRRTRVYDFAYGNPSELGDKRPKALFLGAWWHPTTGNRLFGAINLNYLDRNQLSLLQRELTNIFSKNRNLKDRARKVRELLPDVFNIAYRTYDIKHVSAVTLDTVNFIPPEEADKILDPYGAITPDQPKRASATKPKETEPELERPEQESEQPEPVPEVEEAPEIPEMPELPVLEPLEQDQVDTVKDRASRPTRDETKTGEAAGPEIPQIPAVKPTSHQRRVNRPEVVDDPSAKPSINPNIHVKQDKKPKPTSYQKRKGILGRIKDKITSTVGGLLSKWRKKKSG